MAREKFQKCRTLNLLGHNGQDWRLFMIREVKSDLGITWINKFSVPGYMDTDTTQKNADPNMIRDVSDIWKSDTFFTISPSGHQEGVGGLKLHNLDLSDIRVYTNCF